MPLWDSSALQINAIPRASSVDGTVDTFTYYDLSANAILRHKINEIKGLEHYSFLLSQGYNGTIAATATAGTFVRRLIFPHNMKIRNLVATNYAVQTTGVNLSAIDILVNSVSVLTNSTVPSTVTLVMSNNNFWGSCAPNLSKQFINKNDFVDVYMTGGISVRGVRAHIIGWRV